MERNMMEMSTTMERNVGKFFLWSRCH